MKNPFARDAITVLILLIAVAVAPPQQADAQSSSTSAPTLLPIKGELRAADGRPRTDTVLLVLALYDRQDDSAPRWIEQQAVKPDADGRYTVQFGATREEGLPMDLFTGPVGPRWIGVTVEKEPEQPRVMLVSVPYAVKAASAETLAGRPASDFVLSSTFREDLRTALQQEPQVNDSGHAVSYTVSDVTQNFLQKGDGAGGHADALNLVEVNGNLGVGTITPAARMHVVANAASGALVDVYSDTLGTLPLVYRAARGTPAAPSAVQTDDILGGLAVRGYGATGFSAGQGQVMFRAAEPWTDAQHGTYLQLTTTPLGSTNWVERLRIDSAGRVGIGAVPTGTALLRVAGDAVVDGNIAAKYQDVAEWVETGERLAPGTVVVVDPDTTNGARVSQKAYDIGVAGVVSAQPGILLGDEGASKSLVAQSGRVKVKVDAGYGPIKAGDLLVTSPTAGYAMRSQPVRVANQSLHRPGTLLGKALEALPRGKGEILVLLTLQ
jgi:hypothetical protein